MARFQKEPRPAQATMTEPATAQAPPPDGSGASGDPSGSDVVQAGPFGRTPTAGAAKTPAAAAKAGPDELIRLVRGQQPERFDRLAKIRKRNPPTGIEATFILLAAALRCLYPECSHRTDLAAAGVLRRYLRNYVELHGTLDPYAAMRRSNVDAYLLRANNRGDDKSLHTFKATLYQSGRKVHPHQYPKGTLILSRKPRALPPVPDAIVAELYATAAALADDLGRRAEVLLDLGLGAGARPRDFHLLRGSDITSIRYDGRDVAVVRLSNLAGGHRQIPILDRAMSRRILQRAKDVGDGLLLAPGGPAERNLTNRVTEHLKLRGHRGIDLKALRNNWILTTAERVPTTMFLQLADVSTTLCLADHRERFPRYGVRATAVALEGGDL